MWLFKFSHLLRLLLFFQLYTTSFGFFFPLFGNFFNRFRNNHNGNHFSGGGGGSSGYSNNGGGSGANNNVLNTAAAAPTAGVRVGTGNITSIRVPMLTTGPQRRVDVVTTVINHGPVTSDPVPSSSNSSSSSSTTVSAEESSLSPQQIELENNVTTITKGESQSRAVLTGDTRPSATVTVETRSDQQLLTSQRFIVPTSTSVTSSISAVQQGVPLLFNQGQLGTPNTLTLPFTPNLFGMMAYVQALKDIKRNYKDQEKERKIMLFNKEGGDLMTRILRTLIHKVVNKYQKGTEILKLKILKRQGKLQKFLQLPMVSQVIAMDQARAVNSGIIQPVALGNTGIVPSATAATQFLPFSRSGKPLQNILSSFLIR